MNIMPQALEGEEAVPLEDSAKNGLLADSCQYHSRRREGERVGGYVGDPRLWCAALQP